MRSKVLAIITLTFAAFAVESFAQSPLTGQEWSLTYLRGVNLGRTSAFIDFNWSGRRFNGNTGCNSMSGSVDVRGRTIDFGSVATTRRACERRAAEVERGILDALERANRFQMNRSRFRLYAGARLLAEFAPRSMPMEEEPTPVGDQLALEDRRWVLHSIAGASIPKIEQEAFIVFDPVRKSAGGNTGCNVFGGSYMTDGNKLKITETISTMRACIEDERMEIERGFLNGLRDVNRFEVRADKLYLYRGNQLLLTLAGRKRDRS